MFDRTQPMTKIPTPSARLERWIAFGASGVLLGAGVALWALHGPGVFSAMITGFLSLCF